ncbi:hypothetical protein [Cohnella terricola]|uniref:Uncharacterized protein n=1 Tax=Cohnella terricola TaxID=1289167 RepID=A0A559JQ95_9BACL|nr:hypothetical protein [Cohnella terricola]TVY02054.1 hypothetical protein FPZ45_06325 [Cohnella terricola]
MVRIQFHNLHIGTVSNSSGVFHGSNVQWKYKHAAKQNQAFGTVNGKNCFLSGVRVSLNDSDPIDTYSSVNPRQT